MTEFIKSVTAAYEKERQNNLPPRTADDIPFTYEAITDEWLTNILCGGHSGAKVVAHRLDVVDNGNSNRRRIFIDYNEAGRAAGLPARVFCKASQGLANRISLGMAGAIQSEVNYYNVIRPQLNIETPVSCFAHFNSALNSIIVMRELDPRTVFCTHTTDITRARAEDQLRVLASVHGKFLESPEFKTSLSMFSTWSTFFGKLDYPDFEKACDHGFGISEEAIPARLFARRKEIWAATRKSVETHFNLPHTVCHGDDHLRNWYIAANGAMGLADWQAITLGHWSRDVVYAVTTSLTVENRRLWEKDLLRYYLDQLRGAAGRAISTDGVFDHYRQQLMTILAFWTITINPAPGMPDMQPRNSTLEFIRRIAVAIDDLESLDCFK
jgi:hypothetical protein